MRAWSALSAVVAWAFADLAHGRRDCLRAEAAPVPASSTTVWLVVCTPPRCDDALPALELLRRRAGLEVVSLSTLHNETSYMKGQSRSRKVRILHEYLSSAEGSRWETIVYTDAMDVLANAADAAAVGAALRTLAPGPDRLLVSAEPSCWIGAVCDAFEVSAMKRRAPAHFSRTSPTLFLNSGQWLGTRRAVLAFLEYAIRVLDDMEARGGSPPPDLDEVLSPSRRAEALAGTFHCSDQCVLTTYWLAHLDRVVLDVDAAVFGSMKRFYVYADDDRGVRTPLEATDAKKRPGIGWRAAPRVAWPSDSKFADRPPPPDCARLEQKQKAFLEGPGNYCEDYAHIGAAFSFACDADGPPPLVYADPGPEPAAGAFAAPRLAPLLGWHANGHVPTTFFHSLAARLCHGTACTADAAAG
jgi:hypothetical protein